MTDRTSKWPLDLIAQQILCKANERDEIGYAHTKDNKQWPLVETAMKLGLIVYSHDKSPGIDSLHYGQRRDIYVLTAKGRQLLKDYKESNHD